MVENQPSNTGDTDSVPDLKAKIPCTTTRELHTTTTEPMCSRTHALQQGKSLHTVTTEKPVCPQEDPAQPKGGGGSNYICYELNETNKT